MPDFENYQPHPTLLQPITPEQRARATRWLVDAYHDDKLGPADYERRYAEVQRAQNRGQMDAAFAGLLRPPSVGESLEPVPPSAVSARPRPVAAGPTSGGGPGPTLAHASFFLFWIFGPLLAYAVGRPGSATRREAAKAFNWQLTSFIGMVGMFTADVIADDVPLVGHVLGAVTALCMFVWFVLTIIGMVKAGQGDDWTNPVMRVVRWKPMREE